MHLIIKAEIWYVSMGRGVSYNIDESATRKVNFGTPGAHLRGGEGEDSSFSRQLSKISKKIRTKLLYHAMHMKSTYYIFSGTTLFSIEVLGHEWPNRKFHQKNMKFGV